MTALRMYFLTLYLNLLLEFLCVDSSETLMDLIKENEKDIKAHKPLIHIKHGPRNQCSYIEQKIMKCVKICFLWFTICFVRILSFTFYFIYKSETNTLDDMIYSGDGDLRRKFAKRCSMSATWFAAAGDAYVISMDCSSWLICSINALISF